MLTIRSLTLCALVGVTLASEATPNTPLTLAAAIDASRADHPSATVASARLAEAQAKLRQANAALMPRVSVGSSYSVTDQPMGAFMGLVSHGAYSQSINPNDPPTVDNLNLGVNIRVPLYTPGTWSGRLAATHGAEAARYAQEAALNALTFTTVQAFIGVHQAKAHVIAATASLNAADAHVVMARNRQQAGTLSKAELLGLEAQMAAARSQVAAANGGVELAGQALAAALGHEGSVTNIAAVPSLSAPTTLVEKPDLIAAQEQVAAAEASIDQARSHYLPRLGAFGGYGYDRGFKQNGEGMGWQVGVGVEWNIFAGGATQAGIAEAAAKRAAAQAELKRAHLQNSQGRAAAQTRLTTITAQLEAVRAQVAAAEESARLYAERFAAGAANASDVALAEAMLAQARSAVADAEAGQQMTLAELRWQSGLPILP